MPSEALRPAGASAAPAPDLLPAIFPSIALQMFPAAVDQMTVAAVLP